MSVPESGKLGPVHLRTAPFLALLQKYEFDEYIQKNQDYWFGILDEALKYRAPDKMKVHEKNLLAKIEYLVTELYDRLNGALEEYIVSKNRFGKCSELEKEIEEAKATFAYLCISKHLRLRLCDSQNTN